MAIHICILHKESTAYIACKELSVVVSFSQNLQDTVCCNKAIAWFLKLATPDGSPVCMQVRIHGNFSVLAYSVLEAMDFSWRRTLFSTNFNIMPTPEVAAAVHKILSSVPLL